MNTLIGYIITERKFKNIPDWVIEQMDFESFEFIVEHIADDIVKYCANCDEESKSEHIIFKNEINVLKRIYKTRSININRAIDMFVTQDANYNESPFARIVPLVARYFLRTDIEWSKYFKLLSYTCEADKKIKIDVMADLIKLALCQFYIFGTIPNTIVKYLMTTIDTMFNDGYIYPCDIHHIIIVASNFEILGLNIDNFVYELCKKIDRYKGMYYSTSKIFSLANMREAAPMYLPVESILDSSIAYTYLSMRVFLSSVTDTTIACIRTIFNDENFYEEDLNTVVSYIGEMIKLNINNIRILSAIKGTVFENKIDMEYYRTYVTDMLTSKTKLAHPLTDYRYLDVFGYLNNDKLQYRFIEDGGNPSSLLGYDGSFIYTSQGINCALTLSSFEQIEDFLYESEILDTIEHEIIGIEYYDPVIRTMASHIAHYFDTHEYDEEDDICQKLMNITSKINSSYTLTLDYHKLALMSSRSYNISRIIDEDYLAASYIPFWLQSYDTFVSIVRGRYLPINFGIGSKKGIEHYLEFEDILNLVRTNNAYIADISDINIVRMLMNSGHLWMSRMVMY